MAIRGREIFREFPMLTGAAPVFHEIGYAFLSSPETLEQARRNTAMQRAEGAEVEELPGSELGRFAPGASADGVAAIFHEARSGYADPIPAAEGFIAAAVRSGAGARAGVRVSRLLREGSRITGVETPEGRIAAKAVVLAAGAWSKDARRDGRGRAPDHVLGGAGAAALGARRVRAGRVHLELRRRRVRAPGARHAGRRRGGWACWSGRGSPRSTRPATPGSIPTRTRWRSSSTSCGAGSRSGSPRSPRPRSPMPASGSTTSRPTGTRSSARPPSSTACSCSPAAAATASRSPRRWARCSPRSTAASPWTTPTSATSRWTGWPAASAFVSTYGGNRA